MEPFKIQDYFLDIQTVNKIECDITKSKIYEYYSDLISNSGHVTNTKTGMHSLFFSMIKSGYLKSITQEERDEKIVSVLT